jgi:hypothetical protein
VKSGNPSSARLIFIEQPSIRIRSTSRLNSRIEIPLSVNFKKVNFWISARNYSSRVNLFAIEDRYSISAAVPNQHSIDYCSGPYYSAPGFRIAGYRLTDSAHPASDESPKGP